MIAFISVKWNDSIPSRFLFITSSHATTVEAEARETMGVIEERESSRKESSSRCQVPSRKEECRMDLDHEKSPRLDARCPQGEKRIIAIVPVPMPGVLSVLGPRFFFFFSFSSAR